jgi:hypothetical protein
MRKSERKKELAEESFEEERVKEKKGKGVILHIFLFKFC